jgi:hypothetical protein
MSSTLMLQLTGDAKNNATDQITPMTIFEACFDDRALSGFKIAYFDIEHKK